MGKILNILIAVGMAAWFFTFLTVDSRRYYAPTTRYSFEQYWAWYGMGTEPTPENPNGVMPIEEARSKYPDGFAREQARYQEWLGQIAVDEQQRLSEIHSGVVPKWQRSAITAQWYANNTVSKLGECSRQYVPWEIEAWNAGYLVLVAPLLVFILAYRVMRGERDEDRFRSGIALLLTPAGWYRLAVMVVLFLSSGHITGFFGGFAPFWWALCLFYSFGFALLFYRWFLRDA